MFYYKGKKKKKKKIEERKKKPVSERGASFSKDLGCYNTLGSVKPHRAPSHSDSLRRPVQRPGKAFTQAFQNDKLLERPVLASEPHSARLR